MLVSLSQAAAGSANVEQEVRESLEKRLAGLKITEVRATPVAGLYQVVADGNVFYVSADGEYLVRGEIIRLADRENLTEKRRQQARIDALDGYGEARMIVFEPDEVRHTVTVFTDIDCGFCRRLHAEMDEYLGRGIRVRYLFFPRSGSGTSSFRKAEAVWCSADRHDAMNRAKAGENVQAAACENPVHEHLQLGRQLNVRGTPAVFTDSGRYIGGLLSPAQMEEVLADP